MLGPNGAGKTTTVQILSTLIPASGGQALVVGHNVQAEPDAVRSAIEVTGQFSAVDRPLTGRENLLLMADLRHLDRDQGQARATQLLAEFGLTEAACVDLLRWHAAPAGHRDDADDQAAHPVPGRADHRAGPARPPPDVADRPRPGGQRGAYWRSGVG